MSIANNLNTFDTNELVANGITDPTVTTELNDFYTNHPSQLNQVANQPATADLILNAVSQTVDDTSLDFIGLTNRANVTVTGAHDVTIATDDIGFSVINDTGTGHDTIFTGTGPGNQVTLGAGADHVLGQGLGETITGGTGNAQSIIEAGTSGTLNVGSGAHDFTMATNTSAIDSANGATYGTEILTGGAGSNIVQNGVSGSHNTLIAAGDSDNIIQGIDNNDTIIATGTNANIRDFVNNDVIKDVGTNDALFLFGGGKVFGDATTQLNLRGFSGTDTITTSLNAITGVETLTDTTVGQTVKVGGGVASATLSDGTVIALTDTATAHSAAIESAAATHVAAIIAHHAAV